VEQAPRQPAPQSQRPHEQHARRDEANWSVPAQCIANKWRPRACQREDERQRCPAKGAAEEAERQADQEQTRQRDLQFERLRRVRVIQCFGRMGGQDGHLPVADAGLFPCIGADSGSVQVVHHGIGHEHQPVAALGYAEREILVLQGGAGKTLIESADLLQHRSPVDGGVGVHKVDGCPARRAAVTRLVLNLDEAGHQTSLPRGVNPLAAGRAALLRRAQEGAGPARMRGAICVREQDPLALRLRDAVVARRGRSARGLLQQPHLREPAHDLRGAVRGAIVYDQHFVAVAHDLVEHRCDVADLVVDRQGSQRSVTHEPIVGPMGGEGKGRTAAGRWPRPDPTRFPSGQHAQPA